MCSFSHTHTTNECIKTLIWPHLSFLPNLPHRNRVVVVVRTLIWAKKEKSFFSSSFTSYVFPSPFSFRAKMHHFCYLFSIGISLFLMICSPAHSTLNVFLFFFWLVHLLTRHSLHFGVVVARLTVTVINKRVVCRHSHCVPLWNFVCLLLVFGSFSSTALFLAWPTLLFSLLLLCMFLVPVLTGRKAHSFGCNNNMPLTYSLLYTIACWSNVLLQLLLLLLL